LAYMVAKSQKFAHELAILPQLAIPHDEVV